MHSKNMNLTLAQVQNLFAQTKITYQNDTRTNRVSMTLDGHKYEVVVQKGNIPARKVKKYLSMKLWESIALAYGHRVELDYSKFNPQN